MHIRTCRCRLIIFFFCSRDGFYSGAKKIWLSTFAHANGQNRLTHTNFYFSSDFKWYRIRKAMHVSCYQPNADSQTIFVKKKNLLASNRRQIKKLENSKLKSRKGSMFKRRCSRECIYALLLVPLPGAFSIISFIDLNNRGFTIFLSLSLFSKIFHCRKATLIRHRAFKWEHKLFFSLVLIRSSIWIMVHDMIFFSTLRIKSQCKKNHCIGLQ